MPIRHLLIPPLIILSCLFSACAMVQKPDVQGSAASQSQLVGAAMIAMVTSGYEIDQLTQNGLTAKRRVDAEDTDISWVLKISTSDGRYKVDVDVSPDTKRKVSKEIAWQMEMVGAHIQRELAQSPANTLETLGESADRFHAVAVGPTLPSPECQLMGQVRASANPRDSEEELKNALEGRLRLETLALAGNYVQTSYNPGQDTQAGGAFDCPND